MRSETKRAISVRLPVLVVMQCGPEESGNTKESQEDRHLPKEPVGCAADHVYL